MVEANSAPEGLWRGKLSSRGWTNPGAGTMDTIGKATGSDLGLIGVTSANDVAPRRGLRRLHRSNRPRFQARWPAM